MTRRSLAVALAALVVVSGCSDDDGGGDAESEATPLEAGEYTVPTPEISPPPAEGAGMAKPQPAVPPAAGYTEEELFVSGTATSFESVDTPDDGKWTAALSDEADYQTRVIVRRPPAQSFSGTVLVEWLNVSAIESSPDWAYLAEEIGREGHAYVAVSAQAQGIEGGETLLEVTPDSQALAETGASADTSGLKNVDPARYGTLEHPGDAYAFDIYSQVGRAIFQRPDAMLGGLQPQYVIAAGESQSAGFLTTVLNALHPLDPVYDAFLIHSRGANPAPLDGLYESNSDDSVEGAEFTVGSVQVRTDRDEPTLIFETETDLTVLGYSNARQPDSDRVRTWEVAGTAHTDQHMMRSLLGGPRDASSGDLLGCTEPINIGPQHEVLSAAVHHLVGWVAGGEPPPEAERIELDEDDDEVAEVIRDENQIAVGGVRTPLVDVPVAASTGDPSEESIEASDDGELDICVLFGTTIPFDQDTLVEMYGTFDTYLQEFEASAAEAVAAGFLVQGDADQLIAEAELNAALFPPS
ncbi:MAG TPA: alpha/beta hydrolase domain-containing protein [Microthrixaceae bacterium]|nr:alpha/beta hydrolase domain-containing protein [Microthrixaceae bacterium]